MLLIRTGLRGALILAFAMSFLPLSAQEKPVDLKKIKGRDQRRTGIHDGNLVFTRYSNFGNLGSRFEPPKMEWPKGSGQWYGFEFIMMAGAEVVDLNGNFYHIVSENYTNPGSFDISPDGTHTYGWEPLENYFNEGPANFDNFPAMSHRSETWPLTWPVDYPGVPGSRDGLWNGEFGAFVRADQESYYVMDDRNNDEFDYFPFIGSSTDSADFPAGRRGLGLEVAVRGYQWVNVEAEDILIVRYDIKNISDKNLDKMVFGMYVDPAVGGEGDSVDDFADFRKDDDIVYMWDLDGIDNQGRPGVGYFGFAFLESPGDPLDGDDNDEDGLVDERQDNERGELIFGPIGNFGEPKLHWEGDEDGDWLTYFDANENGQWDAGEEINDDKGSDGVGPDDEDYRGPDGDGTEGNGMPDFGEPNFGKTDNDESDQIGLTSYVLRPAGNVSDDERTWSEMLPGVFGGSVPSNLAFIYGSGYFSLPQEETRKFAIACLFGRDFDDILRNKRTMQRIYDADYSFTKPPRKPTLTAVAGDQQVVLMWDDRAERSRDPIYGRDFEGYLIYRSTDPSFNSIKEITDSFGNPILWKPIAQFDLDNGLQGPHPVPIGQTGAAFNSGNDTGLRHFYVDRGLENGRTYYYAVVSYDAGYDVDFFNRGISTIDKLTPVAPSECSKIIQTDLVGNVTFIDENCAVMVPNAPSAGFVAGGIEGEVEKIGPATGTLDIEVLLPDSVEDGQTYRVSFTDTTEARLTSGLIIENTTSGEILYQQNPIDSLALSLRMIDGMLFNINNVPVATPQIHGWTDGNSNLAATVDLEVSGRTVALPEDIEIRVKDGVVDTSFTGFPFVAGTPVNFEIWGLTTGQRYKFVLEETDNPDGVLSPGDMVTMAFNIQGFRFNLGWKFSFSAPAGEDYRPPQPGDVYRLLVSKPFSSADEYIFQTRGSRVEEQLAKTELDDIYVVPDPYVVNASWEKPLFFSSGRGERRIDFVNLPARCTIRIYTVAGKHVQTLEHDSPIDKGAKSWDLVSKDGLTVSFGVYIFHVDAPGIGEKIGKFTLIK